MADGTMQSTLAHDEKRDEPKVREDVARELGEPVGVGAAAAVASDASPEQSQEPAAEKTGIRARLHNFRMHTIEVLPRFVVNNAVSIISGLHLASELLMLKSGGMQFLKNNRGGTKVNYLIDPINNLQRGLRGLDKQAVGGKAVQNAWALRSTAVGFTGWLIGTFVPNKKDDEENILKDAEAFERSKIGYLGKRTIEALQPWKPSNKRQFVGLAVTVAGVFSALSGLTNIGGDGRYYFNKSRTMGGIITTVAGSSLLYSLTDRDAWARYGKAIWLRLPFIGLSIDKMYKKTIEFKGSADVDAFNKASKEWKFYAAGAAGFQTASTISYLFGGVQKLEDGTIIDKKEEKDEAKAQLAEKKRIAVERGVRVQDVPYDDVKNVHAPHPTVTKVSQHEAAMPERVAAHAGQQT